MKKRQGSHPQRKICITSNCRTRKKNPFACAGTGYSCQILACKWGKKRQNEKKRIRNKRNKVQAEWKPIIQKDCWFTLPIDRNRCVAATVNGHQRMRERGEGCIPMDSIKQKYCLETLGQMVPLSSHNHFNEEMRALMNGIVLYRRETNNSEVKAETAPFIHTLDSTTC